MNWTWAVTAGFLVIIFAIFADLGLRLRRYSQAAAILTSLGILGTFVGVTIALLSFNTDDIQSSVPALLDGMKVAFITSVAGIFFAIILKWIAANIQSKEGKVEGKTADDIADLLERQLIQDQGLGDKLHEIRNALVGEGDTTLLSQFRLMRQDASDQHRAMLSAFEEFSQTLAENSSKALIEALRQVIQDFNVKITEQFGDNFKQLNSAVGRLLEWQDQYRGQLEDTLVTLHSVQNGVKSMEGSLQAITQRAESLTTSAQSLEVVLKSIRTTQEELEARLSAFAGMANDAQSAFPKVQENLDRLTSGFANSVRDAVSAQQKMNESMAESFEKLRGVNETYTSHIKETTTSAIDRMSSAVRDSVGGASDEVKKMLTTMDREIRSLSESNTRAIQTQVKQLDEDLGEALTKSLNTLGSQLATLSGKFVEDYEPLTKELQRLVQVSRGTA